MVMKGKQCLSFKAIRKKNPLSLINSFCILRRIGLIILFFSLFNLFRHKRWCAIICTHGSADVLMHCTNKRWNNVKAMPFMGGNKQEI